MGWIQALKLHGIKPSLADGARFSPERRKHLAALMAEAEARADTEMTNQRVALWRDSIWKWMLESRTRYQARRAEGGKADQFKRNPAHSPDAI
jgi:hypothetical protein